MLLRRRAFISAISKHKHLASKCQASYIAQTSQDFPHFLIIFVYFFSLLISYCISSQSALKLQKYFRLEAYQKCSVTEGWGTVAIKDFLDRNLSVICTFIIICSPLFTSHLSLLLCFFLYIFQRMNHTPSKKKGGPS